MVESEPIYEQLRKRRLEENKKRMEELNLNKLAQAFHQSSPKSSPAKQVKPRGPRQPVDLTPVRRSSRVADKPKPNYKDSALEPSERPRRSYQRRDLLNRVYASDEVRTWAIERAEQLQSTLDQDAPSFVKPMFQSHVSGGFWLGLPVQFCKTHLPQHDEIMALVDEAGEEFPTKYLADKTGLSGGWRGFSLYHELVDGDALVFHLVKPTEFKVYIIRAYEAEDNEDNVENENDDKGSEVTKLDKSAKRTRASRK
ncbi:hypothetical protein SLEP1_g32367 [Rubroshorea leprosula]|uniref:TF-B3 domain-containing protein n=1 Tax=Rubroshorea leprosula TaxID=152421 RepID=A0AAV5KD21_9ROSI|nr:hypothetical protein SLEP1_g32367 [Rubroshorea leprosula]